MESLSCHETQNQTRIGDYFKKGTPSPVDTNMTFWNLVQDGQANLVCRCWRKHNLLCYRAHHTNYNLDHTSQTNFKSSNDHYIEIKNYSMLCIKLKILGNHKLRNSFWCNCQIKLANTNNQRTFRISSGSFEQNQTEYIFKDEPYKFKDDQNRKPSEFEKIN